MPSRLSRTWPGDRDRCEVEHNKYALNVIVPSQNSLPELGADFGRSAGPIEYVVQAGNFSPSHSSKVRQLQDRHSKAEKDRVRSRWNDAINHFSRAISIDPGYIAARNNLAVAYMTIANPPAAIVQLEKAIIIDPGNPILYGNLSFGYVMSQRFSDAERTARVAVNLDRTGVQASMFLGLALVQQQKFTEEALQCFNRARDKYPVAHLLAGRVFIALGKGETARSEILTYLSSRENENRALANKWLDSINLNERAPAKP